MPVIITDSATIVSVNRASEGGLLVLFGKVTFFGLPLFVRFHQHRGGEAEQGSFVGEHVATRVRRLISRFSRSRVLLVRSRRRCSAGKSKTVSPSGTLDLQPGSQLGAVAWYFFTSSPEADSPRRGLAR